jgi:hypothetical protein
MTDRIRFLEAKYTHFYHDLRVFICGVEVSSDLRGSLAVSISDGTAPNTATITLDNALDKYVFTEENAQGLYGDDLYERYGERAKAQIVLRKLSRDGKITKRDREATIQEQMEDALAAIEKANNPESMTVTAIRGVVDEVVNKLSDDFFNETSTDETRTTIMSSVISKFASLNTSTIREQMDTSITQRANTFSGIAKTDVAAYTPPKRHEAYNNPPHSETLQALYSFDVGDLVINKNDPVVVYAHNPLTENDEWYPAFTGFVKIATETTDETTGESSVTLQCECIRALMKKIRISLNAALAQYEPDIVMNDPDLGYFRDVIDVNDTPFSTILVGKSLEDAVCLLVTGKSSVKAATDKQEEPSQQEKQDPNPERAAKGQIGRFSMGEVIPYPVSQNKPDKSNVADWIPKTGGTDADAAALSRWHSLSVFGATKDFITDAEVTRRGSNSYLGGDFDPWSRKLHMILPAQGTNVATLANYAIDQNRNQFQFTDRWTIIREVAQLLDYQFYTSPNGDLLLEFPMYDFSPQDFGPSWAPIFTYFNHLISSSVTPESDDIPAGLILDGSLTNIDSARGPVTMTRRVMAYSKNVAAKYGTVGILREEARFLTDLKQLDAYAAVMYQRMLANASGMVFSAAHRPFLMPNRPILHERRNRLGLSYSVDNTWEIEKTVTTEIAVRAIRKRVRDGNNYVYRFITGGTNLAISTRLPVLGGDSGQTRDDDTKKPEVKLTPENKTGVSIASSDSKKTAPKVSNADFKNRPSNLDSPGIFPANLTDKTRDVLYKAAACVSPTRIKITSGKRTVKRNNELHGEPNSKHLTGEAFDVSLRTTKQGSDKYSELLSPPELEKLIGCILAEGYDVEHETQPEGPHLHCEPAKGKEAVYNKRENKRIVAARARRVP